jgi:hypothetical protein
MSMSGGIVQRLPGLFAVLAIGVSACTQPPGQPAGLSVSAVPGASAFGVNGYNCPVNGTVVVRETLEKTSAWYYRGTDPADPNACLMFVNGKVGSYMAGLVAKNANQPGDFGAAYRTALSGPPGTAAEYRNVMYDGQNNIERVENEGLETLQIGTEARTAVRIAHTETALGAGGFVLEYRRWFDVQTGALIQQSYQLLSGKRPSNDPTNQDWTATSIRVPR